MNDPIAVHLGDCFDFARKLSSNSIDLVYVDPPFYTRKDHILTTRDRTKTFEFSDRWISRKEYLDFLKERIVEFRRVLKDQGSLFFHCDTNASHHVRCLLDEVFGEHMFRAEIIWHYLRWTNSQRAPVPAHQTIYFYSKTETYKYNQIFKDYSPSTNVDQILQRRTRDNSGKAVYERDAGGNAVTDGNKHGVPISDVWDIPFLNPKAKERVGYPTQKPILLLERILAIASDPGDCILDPFCGSGTTLAAAALLGRKAIGVDISKDAVALSRDRLKAPVRTSSNLLEKGRQSYIVADSDALTHLQGLPFVPVQRNRGIDAILPRQPPVFIRVQRKNEPLIEALELLRSATQSKGTSEQVLIVTEPDSLGLIPEFLPTEVKLVECTALRVKDLFKREKKWEAPTIST
jgi:site-specific DNA-methyltransferase (adenine-specific)